MPRSGRRHRLVLYTYMLNRWWKLTLATGMFLLVLAMELEVIPIRFQYQYMMAPQWLVLLATATGGYAVILSLAFLLTRKSAYIQPYDTHLQLVTPIMRMNISYRRILQTSTVEMQHLFPIGNYRGQKQKLLRPLAAETAIVLEMRGWPLPRWVMGLFLSPLFFPGKSSRLAVLVPDWMDCSMDIESFRSSWTSTQIKPGTSPESALLASISRFPR
jgi:hypothetical protein